MCQTKAADTGSINDPTALRELEGDRLGGSMAPLAHATDLAGGAFCVGNKAVDQGGFSNA